MELTAMASKYETIQNCTKTTLSNKLKILISLLYLADAWTGEAFGTEPIAAAAGKGARRGCQFTKFQKKIKSDLIMFFSVKTSMPCLISFVLFFL